MLQIAEHWSAVCLHVTRAARVPSAHSQYPDLPPKMVSSHAPSFFGSRSPSGVQRPVCLHAHFPGFIGWADGSTPGSEWGEDGASALLCGEGEGAAEGGCDGITLEGDACVGIILGEGACDGSIPGEGACDGSIPGEGDGIDLGDSCAAGTGARFVFLTHPSVEHQKPSSQSSVVVHDGFIGWADGSTPGSEWDEDGASALPGEGLLQRTVVMSYSVPVVCLVKVFVMVIYSKKALVMAWTRSRRRRRFGRQLSAGAGARFVFLTHPSVEHQKPSPQSSAVPHGFEQYCSPFSSTAQNASASVQSASTLQDVPIAATAELTHKQQQQRASSSAMLAIIV